MQFFEKIKNFFRNLFGLNKTCAECVEVSNAQVTQTLELPVEADGVITPVETKEIFVSQVDMAQEEDEHIIKLQDVVVQSAKVEEPVPAETVKEIKSKAKKTVKKEESKAEKEEKPKKTKKK